MFCPKCGKETDASGKFCQWCGTDIEAIAPKAMMKTEPEENEEEEPITGNYAGLGRRFFAFVIDAILILLFDLIAAAVLGLVRGLQYLYWVFYTHVPVAEITTQDQISPATFYFMIIASYGVLLFIIPWLYFAGFECSRGQATPGKTLLRIAVCVGDDDAQERLARCCLAPRALEPRKVEPRDDEQENTV